jgi:flagellar biosynthesis protein FlhF
MSSAASEPIPFLASSAEEAVTQIRARLGPDAVVLQVRSIKASGLARLWQKPMIEVLACCPEPPPSPPPAPAPAPAPSAAVTEALAGFRQELDEIKQQVDLSNSGWRVGPLLQRTGLLPLYAKQIIDTLKSQHGEDPPAALPGEIALARAQLARCWRPTLPCEPNSIHILIGPSGAGKTVALSKWLTQGALVEGRLARVWRLDGVTANTAESLEVYCEVLGVPSERSWAGGISAISEDIAFIDLPGVDWRSSAAIQELSAQLPQYAGARLHLVLNGAYDISVLLSQARAFSALPIDDLIITHLDEEPNWGKIWNLTLGAGHAIRFLSSGQNVPGDFCEATPEKILARQFPRSLP